MKEDELQKLAGSVQMDICGWVGTKVGELNVTGKDRKKVDCAIARGLIIAGCTVLKLAQGELAEEEVDVIVGDFFEDLEQVGDEQYEYEYEEEDDDEETNSRF